MSDVEVRVSGVCGRITLNRPRAINALTFEMVDMMHTTLEAWAEDPSIQFVLVDGAGERGLCAGGDIRAMYEAAISGNHNVASDFFHAEYRLNYRIGRYRKPYVALMDGIVMGGGIGISAHGSHRVVTERSQLAMPETAIGFIPDVGGSYLLGIAPEELGTYLGLTGSRIGAADAIFCGLADTTVASEDLPQLTKELEQCADRTSVEDCLRAHAVEAPALPAVPTIMTTEQRAWIKECFSASTVEEILAALERHSAPEAKAALNELKKRSPTSLKVTLAALRNGRSLNDLGRCLQQEYRLALACYRGHDFVEGVRAAIVDKDRNPKWSPDTLEAVTPELVQQYFAESSAGGLDLSF